MKLLFAITSAARRVSRLLGRIPSAVYGLAYFTLIPFFALIYYHLPGQFYHATTRYEHDTYKEMPRVLKLLREQFLANFHEVQPTDYFYYGGWRYDITGVSFDMPRVSDDYLTVLLRLDATKDVDGATWTTTHAFNVRIARYLDGTINSEGRTLKRIKSVEIDDISSPAFSEYAPQLDFVRKLFPLENRISSKMVLMQMSADLDDRLEKYMREVSGFPEKRPANFERMLYFSTITIATVGYGDIVPLSTRSRLLTSLEAILGVLLIGLYLNALSHERDASGRVRHPDESGVGNRGQ